MQTLLDFGQEVAKIREAVNSLEVKGEANATLIVFAVHKCNDIIAAINDIVQKQIEEKKSDEGNQNGSEEEVNDEQN